jgi:hypothetical protein
MPVHVGPRPVFLADGNTFRGGAGGADFTATPAAVGAGGLASRAGVVLVDEERSGHRQRSLAAEDVLGVEKGEERNCEDEDIENLGRHCVIRRLLRFEQVALDRVRGPPWEQCLLSK